MTTWLKHRPCDSRIELDFILIIKHSKDFFSFNLKAPPRNEDAWRDLRQFTCKPLVMKGKGLPYFMLGNAFSCATPLILVPIDTLAGYCPGGSDPKIRGGPQTAPSLVQKGMDDMFPPIKQGLKQCSGCNGMRFWFHKVLIVASVPQDDKLVVQVPYDWN